MKADTSTISVSVTSAIALTALEKKEIEHMITGNTDADASLVFSYQINKDVLGGVKVEVGDLVFDTTIASQLKKVKYILDH